MCFYLIQRTLNSGKILLPSCISQQKKHDTFIRQYKILNKCELKDDAKQHDNFFYLLFLIKKIQRNII